MELPPSIRKGVEETLGVPVGGARPLSGGQVARACRVETGRGPFFVKWKEGAPPRFFEMEADGLRRLCENSTLRIPDVITYRDTPLNAEHRTPNAQPFLVLEWLEPRPPADTRRFAERLGEGLARMHADALSHYGFGLEEDNFLGSQPQVNAPCDSWAAFYRDRRLLPQIERARREGRMPPARHAVVMRLVERVEEILAGHNPRPSLVHGDLWAGNLLGAGEEPALIDPAVYYADREVELAYMQLFSGFSPHTFAAYEAAYPLDEGYFYRRPLHQLYPLLIHLNHFGPPYDAAVEEACRSYL